MRQVTKKKPPGDLALSDMALQLSMLLDAGLGYPDIARSVLEPLDKIASDAACANVRAGVPLDRALLSTGLVPAYFADMLGVGLETGKAPESASALHLYYGRMGRLKRQIRNAAVQPALMLASTLCVLAVILVKIFPVFDAAYQSAGMLPGPAMSAMLDIGSFLGASRQAVLLGLAAAGVLAWAACRSKPARGLALRSRTVRAVGNAKFLQAMAMGLDSGMGSLGAMEMAAETAGGDDRFRSCLDRLEASLDSGGWVGSVLLGAGIITDAQSRILKAGLDAGSLPDAMNYIAGEAMDSAENRISKLSGAIEPAITLLGSVLSVATILAAMLPLLEAMSSIG